MEENKSREERTEQKTKQTKEDEIIKKLNAIQTQNGIMMSTIGEVALILYDKSNELNLSNICVANLHICISYIAGALRKIEENTRMYTEE